nr:Uncharacterised protein [Raoultella sp. NCTC 9187]
MGDYRQIMPHSSRIFFIKLLPVIFQLILFIIVFYQHLTPQGNYLTIDAAGMPLRYRREVLTMPRATTLTA